MKLPVRLTPEKASKWIDALKLSPKQGRVGHKDLEILIGKMCFSQTCLFGKFDRCQLRARYLKIRMKWYIPTFSAYEISAARRSISIMHNVSPRMVVSVSSMADWVFYTDADSLAGIIDAVDFQGTPSGFRAVSEAFASTVPEVWMRQFRYTNCIFGFGLLAPVAFLLTWMTVLAGKRVIVFIHNSAALSALIRGDSISGISTALVDVFWRISQEDNLRIWIARVRPNLNISDLTARHVRISCQKKKALSFKNLFQLLPDILRWRVVV